MEYTAGQVVFSKCGRDQGSLFLVAAVDGEYVYLIDGKTRKLAKPKKKKKKHVQGTKVINEALKEKLLNNSYLLDADIVKALKEYVEMHEVRN